jgi:hypothetical protein
VMIRQYVANVRAQCESMLLRLADIGLFMFAYVGLADIFKRNAVHLRRCQAAVARTGRWTRVRAARMILCDGDVDLLCVEVAKKKKQTVG